MPEIFEWHWQSHVPDGQFVPVGGQIYKCDLAKRTFTRIPNHPLSIPPEKAIRLFTIPADSMLDFTGPEVTPSKRRSLQLFIPEGESFERRPKGDPGGGRIKIHIFCSQDQVLSPRSTPWDPPSFDEWGNIKWGNIKGTGT